MRFTRIEDLGAVIVACTISLAAGGCGLWWDSLLPVTAEVTLADSTVVSAPKGSGLPSLANSRWAAYLIDDDSLIARFEFGEAGELLRIYDNTVVPELLGTEISPNGQPQEAPFPGALYLAAFYAAEGDEDFGVVGEARGWFLGLEVAQAHAEANARLVCFGAVLGEILGWDPGPSGFCHDIEDVTELTAVAVIEDVLLGSASYTIELSAGGPAPEPLPNPFRFYAVRSD